MNVIDEEPHSWFLFEFEDSLLFSANCEFSFVGYDFMMFLSEGESKKYKTIGHEYLNDLAASINVSVPISKGSKSIYKNRNVSNEYSAKSLNAVEHWRKINNG